MPPYGPHLSDHTADLDPQWVAHRSSGGTSYPPTWNRSWLRIVVLAEHHNIHFQARQRTSWIISHMQPLSRLSINICTLVAQRIACLRSNRKSYRKYSFIGFVKGSHIGLIEIDQEAKTQFILVRSMRPSMMIYITQWRRPPQCLVVSASTAP